MTPLNEVTIGPCRLICADCMDVLPTLTGVDAVVTDPPYGLGDKWQGGGWKTVCGRLWDGVTPQWDAETSEQAIEWALASGLPMIVWGGNYYPLPPSRCWLIWDKKQKHSGAECEMAWANLDIPTRVFRMSRTDAYVNFAEEPKCHPAEKPLLLMRWCLEFLPEAETILDPFMGSGTSGIACIRTDRQFIGIEKEPRYFKIACDRIQRAWDLKCSELPFDKPAPQVQQQLAGTA